MENVSFYARMAAILSSGEEFTVVDLLETRGSVPQEERAKLIVHPDGRAEGTLGGGDLEARVITDALRLEPGEARVVEYDLASLGMVCGGAVRVLYHRPQAASEEQEFYRDAERRTASGEAVVIAQAVGNDDGGSLPRLLIGKDRVVARVGGAFPDEEDTTARAIELLAPGSSEDCATLSLPGVTIYLERLAPLPRLLIFGAGHIGMALARIAHALGLFQVELADDRDESLGEAVQHGVRVHKVGAKFSGELPALDSRTYAVIVTRSHATDFVVLEQILRRESQPMYVGVIGSRNKKREVFDRLRAAGVSDERLSRVTMPIGLRIGGKSPSEIAVSILAQLVRVKNGLGTGNDEW